MASYQRQIIMGTIIGGSSIVKPKNGRNCYLMMRSRNYKWLAWKANQLGHISSQRPYTKENQTARWHSCCYPLFNEFREMFYRDEKKTITMQALDLLTDLAWTVWYGDSGSLNKNCLWLNTHCFGEEGSNVVCSYFNSLQIECEVKIIRKAWRTVFSPFGTARFLATCCHHMPDFLLASIPDLQVRERHQSSGPCQSICSDPNGRRI